MRKIFFIVIFLSSLVVFSQTDNKSQQQEIRNLLDSADKYSWSSPDKAIAFSEKALVKSREINFNEGKFSSLRLISTNYYIKGFTEKALEYGIEAIKIAEKNNYHHGIASIANAIGLIYQDLKEYEKSIDYFDICIRYSKENKKDFDTPVNNKANSYYFLKQYEKSIELHEQALNIRKNKKDTSGIADCQNDIGLVYIDLKQFEKAHSYIHSCYTTKEMIHDTEGVAFSSADMANLYIVWKKPENAIKYIDRTLEMAKYMKSPRYKEISYSLYAKVYGSMKKFEDAYKYQLLFSDLRDSLRSNESIRQIAEMQTKYDTEKKEQALKLKNIQYEKEKLENKRKTTQRNFTMVGFLLVIILIIIILRSYRIKRKANILLEKQKHKISEKNEELNQQNEEIIAQRDEIENQRDEVIKQKEKIEKINDEVSESIDYATRLQQSILPDTKLLSEYFSDFFVLFFPKDKVSGDFYWWANVENHTIITAADCTGHGVPGAFMSMLGASLLREIVQKEYITHTGVILRKLRKEIIKSLKQKGESGEQKDGMDMAIISIDHQTNIVQFSGANNPLYIVKSGKLKVENSDAVKVFDNSKFAIKNSKLLYEVKPDKMPIAIYERMDKFATHEIPLEKGDQLYMFSDGFADQFGGPKGKKFKYKPFKQLLLENSEKPMPEQKEILEKTFLEWKGKYEQVDDITVLSIKV